MALRADEENISTIF